MKIPPSTPRLAEAVVLYRGDFLTGLALNDCPEFETWLLGEQEYWRQRLTEVLDQVIIYHLQRGEESQAQIYARRWLALEPWREEAHRYLMILLAQSGQRSAALAQFEICRRLLAEELDVEPSAETMQLVKQIRTGEVSRKTKMQGSRDASLRLPGQEGSTDSSPLLESSTPQPVSLDRRNQLLLWDKVKNFWIRGVLEQALQDTVRLDVERRFIPEAIEQPWTEIIEPLQHDTGPISPQTSMLDIFQQCDRALLLLGTPGLGKTITLIDLARQLGTLAEHNLDQPVPVILNLSSWSKQRESLAQWIVRELTIKYQIPHKMGEAWLENNQLILLLDGFDEIALKYHAEGIRAINQFRETNGLTGLAVCSRTEDYTTALGQLRLGGAIQLQPLSLTQIDAYLAEASSQLEFLRSALESEAEYGGSELRGMLESPLMLGIFTRAYQVANGERIRSDSQVVLSTNQNKATRRQHLFGAYVRRMLQRRGKVEPFPARQTEQWLIWLAQKMFHHNQTVFLIEQLQPSWLPTAGLRWLYLLGYRLVEAVAIAMLIWALGTFWQANAPEVVESSLGLISVPLPQPYANGVGALLIAVGLSLLIAIIDGLYFEWFERKDDAARMSRLAIWRHLTVVMVVTLIPIIVITTISPASFLVALYWGIIGGAGFGVFSYLLHGQSFQNSIRSIERLRWSWSAGVKWTLIGLIPGFLFQLITSQLNAFFVGTMVLWILSFFLIGGLQGRDVETKTAPNQGYSVGSGQWYLYGIIRRSDLWRSDVVLYYAINWFTAWSGRSHAVRFILWG